MTTENDEPNNEYRAVERKVAEDIADILRAFAEEEEEDDDSEE